MEKSFKRKMLVVAAVHLFLTGYFFTKATNFTFSGTQEQYLKVQASRERYLNLCAVMQPQFWVLVKVIKPEKPITFVPVLFLQALCGASVLVWSLCFGWLYAKAVDRLNRFPILGLKLF